jgi:predicted CopG family antitoxin
MNQLNELQKLKTIVISEENYQKLKRMGSMGQSFNDVLGRVLQQIKENR